MHLVSIYATGLSIYVSLQWIFFQDYGFTLSSEEKHSNPNTFTALDGSAALKNPSGFGSEKKFSWTRLCCARVLSSPILLVQLELYHACIPAPEMKVDKASSCFATNSLDCRRAWPTSRFRVLPPGNLQRHSHQVRGGVHKHWIARTPVQILSPEEVPIPTVLVQDLRSRCVPWLRDTAALKIDRISVVAFSCFVCSCISYRLKIVTMSYCHSIVSHFGSSSAPYSCIQISLTFSSHLFSYKHCYLSCSVE